MNADLPNGIKVAKPVKIRDKAFAKRLLQACEKNPHCPTGEYRGKHKWIYDNLLEKYGVSVSPESVRKWFNGEFRPRPKVMSTLARLLDVDEAWLSLGLTPDGTPVEKLKRNATANGAVNYVAGLIQLNGGHIAFPTSVEDTLTPDIFAIISGKQYAINVEIGIVQPSGEFLFRVPVAAEGTIIIGLMDSPTPMQYDMLRLSAELLSGHGSNRGDYIEFTLKRSGAGYVVGGEMLPHIMTFDNLDGIVPAKSRKSGSEIVE